MEETGYGPYMGGYDDLERKRWLVYWKGAADDGAWWIEDGEGICQVVSGVVENDVDATMDGVGVRPVIKITETGTGQ